jgi:hypothetical protein
LQNEADAADDLYLSALEQCEGVVARVSLELK